MRKCFAVVAFAMCSFFVNGKSEDWYSPAGVGGVSKTGTVINPGGGPDITVGIDVNGEIQLPRGMAWEDIRASDVSLYNELKAMEQALIARNGVETLAETLDNLNFVTAMKIENGNLQYARGKPNERGEYDWIDAGPLNNYTVMTPNNPNFNTLRAFFVYNEATKKWEQVAGSAQWYSAEVDAKTIVRESKGKSGALKVNHDGSLMIDSDKLSVKAYNAGGIGKDDEKGVYVITKKDTSGLSGGKEAISPGGGLAVNVDNATIGISSKNKVEIKGASANSGKVLMSKGSLEVDWLAEGDAIKFEDKKISIKIDDQSGLDIIDGELCVSADEESITFDEDGFLTVNAGEGLEIIDSLVVKAGDGISYAENGSVIVQAKANGGISVGSDGVSILVDDNTIKSGSGGIYINVASEGALDATDGLSVNYDNQTIYSDSNVLSVKVQDDGGLNYGGDGLYVEIDEKSITKESGEISVNAGAGLVVEEALNINQGDGLSFGDDSELVVLAKADGGIDVDENGVYIKKPSNSGLKLTGDGISVNRGDGLTKNSEAVSVKEKQNGGIEVAGGDNGGVGIKLASNSGLELGSSGLSIQKIVPGDVNGWTGSKWVKIGGGGADPDEHSIDWVQLGRTNKLQIAGYNNRPAGDCVPVARGGGITWMPYNGGISINGVNGTNYVFEAASDTAITFDVDSSANPVKISVSVHWK